MIKRLDLCGSCLAFSSLDGKRYDFQSSSTITERRTASSHVYFRRRSVLDASSDAVHPSMSMPRSSSSAFKSCRGLFDFLTFWALLLSALDGKPSFCRFVLPGGRITDRFPLPVFSLGGEE